MNTTSKYINYKTILSIQIQVEHLNTDLIQILIPLLVELCELVMIRQKAHGRYEVIAVR